jgi:exosortase/archaeosortase family protein
MVEGFRGLFRGREDVYARRWESADGLSGLCPGGIRSTFALVLVSVLAGYVLLRSPVGRICLALAAIPIGIFKNAVRIVALSYLGVYVDRAYLEGRLHHQYGGLIFSSLSLLLVIPLIILLRRLEAGSKPRGEGDGPRLPTTDKIGS